MKRKNDRPGRGERWRIRPARDADWPGIWEIFREAISRGDTLAYPPDCTPEQAKDHWVRNGCRGYVLTAGGKVAGTFTIRANQPGLGNHVANAGYMVHKDYRGRGMAREMCIYSLKEAKKLGFTAMQFNLVVASNAPAVRAWQSVGFKIIGTAPGAFRHAGLGLTDAHIMHRFLDDVDSLPKRE